MDRPLGTGGGLAVSGMVEDSGLERDEMRVGPASSSGSFGASVLGGAKPGCGGASSSALPGCLERSVVAGSALKL
jgi:hypothetical protein